MSGDRARNEWISGERTAGGVRHRSKCDIDFQACVADSDDKLSYVIIAQQN
jgi:hypothetical protein